MDCVCCFTVHTSQVAIIESCGKFDHTASAGFGCLFPCLQFVKGYIPLALQIASVTVDTKTKDNAVVRVEAKIHFRVVEEKAMDAFYKFTSPSEQIGSFAAAIIRGEVPKYTLDELFLMSDEIKKVVKEELTERVLQYGFSLEATLLTKIDPSNDVKQAVSLTQVNAFKRTAAEHDSELNKILSIKQAEADFEEKRLSGVGLAEERKAIMRGLQSSVEEFVDGVPGARARDVMNLLLMNQYFDAMKGIGAQPNNQMVLLPGSDVGRHSKGSSTHGGAPTNVVMPIADMMAAHLGAGKMK